MKRKIICDNDNNGGNKYDDNKYYCMVATTISPSLFVFKSVSNENVSNEKFHIARYKNYIGQCNDLSFLVL
jgi:hypothetical protein